MRTLLISLLAAFGLAASLGTAPALAQSSQAACESLDRPNIDCACVASRIATFNRVSPNDAAKAVIDQGYLFALAMPNTFSESFEAAMSDPMSAMVTVEAYEVLGGRPENIEDYEEGCAIEGAAPTQFPLQSTTSSLISYVSACTASTGDNRFCSCDANRKMRHVSDREFEAYFRSFSDYSDGDATSSAELSEMRGRAMGISAAAFHELQAQARAKISSHEEADAMYCSAMTWADSQPGFDEKTRLLAGFEPGVAEILTDRPEPSEQSNAGPLSTARQIVSDACMADGNSDQYCACYQDEFETRVVAAAPSENVTLAWALMGTSGSGLATTERMRLTQSLPQSDHQAAGMMFMQTMDMGEQCTQGPAAQAPAMQGTPSERMRAICIAENEDEALCGCLVDKMESQFGPDDFELIVDIREAEHRGAEDAFAEVAAQRGLSREDAETALMNNPAIIAATMSMGASMMQCMGGMPTMPSIPGIPME
ncbi:MAG: hypothetical protein ABNH53_08780 [Henriciella sp.]|jgi:hypothetical protein